MRNFLSSDNEPLRRYLYGLLAPALALLLGYGVVDGSTVAAITALVGAVLLVPAVEAARAQVTPDPLGGKHRADG